MWNLDNLKNTNLRAFRKCSGELKKLLAQDNIDIENALSLLGKALDIYETLYSHAYAVFSVDTGNTDAARELDLLEKEHVLLTDNLTVLRKKLAETRFKPKNREYALFVKEAVKEASHQLSDAEERLASELSCAAGDAWSRLQASVSSSISVKWNETERKTVNQLRNMAFDPDRNIRRKAWEAEIGAWKEMEIPLAYSLNGVKKTAIILDEKRKWKNPVDKALFQNRMSAKTLGAMIEVMEESLPYFREYLKKKGTLLGIEKPAFYDIFAPITKEGFEARTWSYDEARKFITETFSSFSPDMGEFAEKAFDRKWIDEEPKGNKIGGAYCTSFPTAGESRVMCNYNPTMSGVSTVAHELGHAYHFDLLKEKSAFARAYPMTLAETASIFAETLIFNTALEKAEGFEKTYITELFLQEVTQVIVDILSRFYFEKEIFERIKKEGSLSAEEFCSIMLDAQKKTYGDALDPEQLHPYMWAVKCHYYSADLGFYNFPYAFGQLFSIGLYRKYLENRETFPELYRKLLGCTGIMDIKGVAKQAGIDIESKEFFRSSMKFITDMIREF